jgi:murein DD-endopeptidase MepM/ murein hydrolase activator NlpD
MTRPFLLGLLLALALAVPALGEDIGSKQRAVEAQIQELQQTLAAQRSKEAALKNEIAGFSSRIQELANQVGDVSLSLQSLRQDLSLRERRLSSLNELFRLQTQRFKLLKRQYAISIARLNARLVAIYESQDVTTLDVVFGSRSIQEALDKANYLTKIGDGDRQVAEEVAHAKRSVQLARTKTATIRQKIQGEARAIAARAAQMEEARSALLGAKGSLDSARQQKLVALSELSAEERAHAAEIDALQQVSAELAAQIRAAQFGNSGPTATPSSAGLVWPVSGPITSPFGWRWGRMHMGIDLGVSYGTPIYAAAAGRVIYCGWDGGYGNLVVLDNGGNLATAYAHQSSIAVACGQNVGRGQVIGYVGSTGHSTGAHLHFEVRINGYPTDPLGYL